MKKSDLRSGDEVVYRNGETRIVELGQKWGDRLRGSSSSAFLYNYDTNMINNIFNKDFDIMSVNRFTTEYGHDRETIYTRKDTVVVDVNGTIIDILGIPEDATIIIELIGRK